MELQQKRYQTGSFGVFPIFPIFQISLNALTRVLFLASGMSKESCCRVSAIVTIDSKGQVVLPKELREKAKLKPDDKLAVIGCESKGEVCCFVMIKAERFGSSVKTMLGPMLKEIFE